MLLWAYRQQKLNVGKMCKPKPSSEVELPRWNRDSELDWKSKKILKHLQFILEQNIILWAIHSI